MKSKPTILLTALLGGLLSFVATSAHAADGTPVWTNVFTRLYNSTLVRSMAVDASGNVYVTGTAGTVKYSNAGLISWTNPVEGTALAVAGNGDAYVGSSWTNGPIGSYTYSTIKYSSTGIPLLTNFIAANSIVVDASGDVYVTGFETAKFSSAGGLLWSHSNSFAGLKLALDNTGNVYVIGASTLRGGSDSDFTTVKYSGAGVPLWTNLFNGASNRDDAPRALAVDASGNVYVAGNVTKVSYSSVDYGTIKYSSAGVPLWTNLLSGPYNDSVRVNALALDANANVFVTGISGGPWSGDYTTVKYSSVGLPLWTNRFNGPQNLGDEATALAMDASGNVYVTGTVGDGYKVGPIQKYATLKYSNSGLPLWTNYFGNGAASALRLDSGGNAFVAGTCYGSSSVPHGYGIIKYAAPPTAPSITAQPLNQTVTGNGGTFTVLASGTPPFTYQWQLNGTNISGANGPSYNLPNPTAYDVGLYTVEICNAADCITSAPATMTLLSLDIHPVLNLSGPIGTAYRIDYSEDLVAPTNWYILTNITLPSSPYLFMDPTSSRQAQRFYRAMQQ